MFIGHAFRFSLACTLLFSSSAFAQAPVALSPQTHQQSTGAFTLPRYSDEQLVDEAQKRAFLFFWEKSDPVSGLTQDRANLDGSDNFDIASIASTGFGLASLPVAVKRRWVRRDEAEKNARKTLRFLLTMPSNYGFLPHWVNKRHGTPEWNREVSSIDMGILLCGALLCGEYFGGETKQLANTLYDRADWMWLLTNAGAQPDKKVLSHGWVPNSGFIPYNYGFCEAVLMYVLAIGSKTHPIPADSWEAMGHLIISYRGTQTLLGGPIFLQQMPQNFLPMKGMRDHLGFDYWVSATNSILINRQFCIDTAGKRKGYGPNFWGLNASDGPDGYKAYGAPNGPEDGTISPPGVLASLPFAPEITVQAAQAMYQTYGDRLWGRYGYADAFNVERSWFDNQVIGIDLGMALLGIENHRSNLIPKLVSRMDWVARAYRAIGLKTTREKEPRVLQVPQSQRRKQPLTQNQQSPRKAARYADGFAFAR